MAIKIILSILVAIFFQITVVKADECITLDSFSSEFAKEGVVFRGSNSAATEKLAALFNKNREARGQPAAQISIFLSGLVVTSSGEPGVLVAVVGKDGCLIQKSVAILTIRQWVYFLNIAGVEPKDFIQLDGA
ncbi:MAG: hypothetical protein WCN98_10675 [Verrucomicrobiaceae bacterium]